jgi:integrase
VAAIRAALRRGGASEGYVERVLADLGLDAPREANSKRKPVARTVRSMDEVMAARPGLYRVVGVKRLYLKKSTRATGSYFVRWRVPGSKDKRPAIGLGSIVDVTLADAIARAGDIDAGLRNGVNPRDIRAHYATEVEAKAAEAKVEAAKPTVAEMAERYVAWMTSDKNEHAWRGRNAAKNFINALKAYAFPAIGALKVNEVTPEHVATVLAAIRSQGLVDKRVRSGLSSLFTWLIESGIRDSKLGNPVSMISASKRKIEHYDRVEPEKAPGVFRELLAAAPGNTAISAWVFMALTAARPSEAITARWSEIDRDAKGGPVWNNPAPKTGRTEPLVVPLSATALAILDERLSRAGGDLAKLAESKALIFAGKGGGKIAHSNFAGGPERAGIDAATPHGWRSVCSDALSEHCHISRDVREACLGHALGGVEGSYRRLDGLKARGIAMSRYEQWLLSGEEQVGNVVEFQRASA